MAGEESNGHWASRLDRMEGLMETLIQDHLDFKDEHRSLLRAQVLLTDHVEKLTLNVDKIAKAQRQLAEAQRKLAEAQRETEERLSALIHIVDDIIRKRPPEIQ